MLSFCRRARCPRHGSDIDGGDGQGRGRGGEEVDFFFEHLDGGFGDLGGIVVGIAADTKRADDGQPACDSFGDAFLGEIDADFSGDLLQDLMCGLFDEVAVADAHDKIAHGHGGTVAEDAVEHLALRECGGLAVETCEVGDHLPLDAPYGHKFRDDGQPAHGAGWQCQSPGSGGGFGGSRIGDLSSAGGGVGERLFLGVGDAPDQFKNGIRETIARFFGSGRNLFHERIVAKEQRLARRAFASV
jgi:hypothetical protein